jgi:replicative DNA helicase
VVIVPTGFKELDETLAGGLRGGQLTLLVGIAGVGTSVFALGLARQAAFRLGIPTVFIAPDSSKQEILARIISAEAKVPFNHIRAGTLNASDKQKVAAQRDRLIKAPMLVNAEWSRAGSAEIITDSVQAWAGDGVRLAVVDGTSETEPLTRELIKSLRLVAHAQRMAIVVVSNVVKPCERRAEPPELEDLREYASSADLFDLIITLHRDDMHHCESTRPGEADVEIAKHRYSPTGRVTIAFQGHYARFVDMAK